MYHSCARREREEHLTAERDLLYNTRSNVSCTGNRVFSFEECWVWYVRDRFDFVCELVLVTVCAGEIEPCVCVVWRGFFYLAPRSALT
jgi:hypothetical protein